MIDQDEVLVCQNLHNLQRCERCSGSINIGEYYAEITISIRVENVPVETLYCFTCFKTFMRRAIDQFLSVPSKEHITS